MGIRSIYLTFVSSMIADRISPYCSITGLLTGQEGRESKEWQMT